MDNVIHILCQTSNGQESDWVTLYEAAFPQDERMPVEEIRQLIAKGTLVLHKSLGSADELLCFSIINQARDFVLLSYIATDSTKRSSGVGSKHLKRLLELVNTHVFLEIESTKEEGLDEAALTARQRRLAFYERLGSKRLCKKYLMPPLQGGTKPRLGELLWLECATSPAVDDAMIVRVIREIYEKAYKLPSTDPLLNEVLSQFPADAVAGTVSICHCNSKSTDCEESGEPSPAVPQERAPDEAAQEGGKGADRPADARGNAAPGAATEPVPEAKGQGVAGATVSGKDASAPAKDASSKSGEEEPSPPLPAEENKAAGQDVPEVEKVPVSASEVESECTKSGDAA